LIDANSPNSSSSSYGRRGTPQSSNLGEILKLRLEER